MKLVRSLFLAGAAAALLVSPARAVEMTAEGPGMEMPKPGPEMEKYKWMVGKWAVNETHEKSAFGPGGPGKGTAVITLGPGGFSHVMDYNSTGPTGKFSGKGITAWDPAAKAYRGAWTDNMTPGIMVMECREEGMDWVCSGESMMGDKKMAMRSRAMNPAPAGWSEVMEVSMDGGPYQKMMTMEYKPAK
jgi:uncharacterized protein DUF1579